MNKDDYFLSRGYKRWEASSLDGDCVECLFQKPFEDKTGIKYYITIKKWDFSRYQNYMMNADPIQYEYCIQLYKRNDHNNDHDAVDVTFHNSWELDDVEEFVEKIFWDFNLDYYERFAWYQ